jgi:hypothetical protein
MANRSAYKLKPMLVTGVVKFENVREAQIYDAKSGKFIPSDDDKATYNITLQLDMDNPAVKEIMQAHKDAIKFERGELAADDQDSVADKPFKALSKDKDKEGKATGYMKLQLKRKASMGAPEVLNGDATLFDGKYIPFGSVVRVQLHGRSYNAFDSVGLSLVLDKVRIVTLAEKGSVQAVAGLFDDETVQAKITDEDIF